MSAPRRISPLLLVLVAGLVLAAAGPVGAHPPSAMVSMEAPPTLIPERLTSLPGGLTAVLQPPALPWALLVGALLAAVAAWRRRRVVVAVALVLLLAVFAFENALHSVHHGFDPAAAKGCAIAAASAQLAATTVDAVTGADLVSPPAEEQVLASDPTGPADRIACFDQGRAPPA